jgi:hypothetical protein
MRQFSPTRQLAIIAIVVFLLLSFGCAFKRPALKVGGLYSVNDGEGNFRVAKVLALDDFAVHIRLYKNKYPVRPRTVDAATLSLGSIKDKDGFGMGHLPLSRKAFANWQPVFLTQSSVTAEELEGYKMWQEDHGGVFSEP